MLHNEPTQAISPSIQVPTIHQPLTNQKSKAKINSKPRQVKNQQWVPKTTLQAHRFYKGITQLRLPQYQPT